MSEQARAEWATADGRWADALRRFEAMESAMAAAPHRYAARLHAARALFDLDLGRRDLACSVCARCARPAAWRPTASSSIWPSCSPVAGLTRMRCSDRLATQPDLSLRLRLLPRPAPHCEPPTRCCRHWRWPLARPVTAAGIGVVVAVAGGARGCWPRGRTSEAADSAVAAWRDVRPASCRWACFRASRRTWRPHSRLPTLRSPPRSPRAAAALRQACLGPAGGPGARPAWERSALARRLAIGVRGKSSDHTLPRCPAEDAIRRPRARRAAVVPNGDPAATLLTALCQDERRGATIGARQRHGSAPAHHHRLQRKPGLN